MPRPPLSWFSAQIRPPCASMIVLEIASPHAHAVRLRGEKRVEDMRERCGRDAGAAVSHGDFDDLSALEPRSHADEPFSRFAPPIASMALRMRLSEYLLQMNAVAAHVRQIGRHFDVQHDLPRRRVQPHKRCDIADERTHVEPYRVRAFLPLEQPAHPIDDVARAFVVRADVRKNRADLVEIRRGGCCRKSSAASALRRIAASG